MVLMFFGLKTTLEKYHIGTPSFLCGNPLNRRPPISMSITYGKSIIKPLSMYNSSCRHNDKVVVDGIQYQS
jgi:hypothetical protein